MKTEKTQVNYKNQSILIDLKENKYNISFLRTIHKQLDNGDWSLISKFQILTGPFITKFKDNLKWNLLVKYQKMSESFIENHMNKLKFEDIIVYQEVSEKFLLKYLKLFPKKFDHILWMYISEYQQLSESFMTRFKNKLEWSNISFNQKMSESFIKEHIDEIDMCSIGDNAGIYQNISEELLLKYKNNFLWEEVLENRQLSLKTLLLFVGHKWDDKKTKELYNRQLKIASNGKYKSEFHNKELTQEEINTI